MATIKDIARAAGFSVSTVSIVLRGQAKQRKIPQQTEEKILAAARSINYQPNLSARKLRDAAAGHYTIGLFWVADFRSLALARILKGLQLVLLDGHHTINLVVSPFVSGRLCDNQSLQGLTNYNAAIIATADEADIRHMEENPPKIPIVLFNRYSSEFSSVNADNDAVGRIAISRFVAKGITDIGIVIQKPRFAAMFRRRSSFIRLCEEHGITSLHNNTIWCDGTVSGGFAAGMKMIERGGIPSGIYCDSDTIALGLQSAFSQNRDRVPEHMELVAPGTADPELTQYTSPPLTLINVPLEEMAARSIGLVIDLLQHKLEPPQHIILPPQLLVRQ